MQPVVKTVRKAKARWIDGIIEDLKQYGDDPKGTGQAGGRKKEKKRMCMRKY